jgi:hypothetical protein
MIATEVKYKWLNVLFQSSLSFIPYKSEPFWPAGIDNGFILGYNYSMENQPWACIMIAVSFVVAP